MFAVAFLTEHFDTTEIMFIPESDLIPETVTGYSYKGGELTIRGQKRLPDDAACCPSGIATVSLSFRDGKVVIRTADR